MPRIIATIPTWNESENILPLISEILALGPEYEVLVIDDDSPDGTWRLAQERAQSEPRVHLLRRVGERGRGTAGVAGFREALRLGADIVIEMDADFSHNPKFIPALVAGLGRGDVVVGSRRVEGGGEAGRNPLRTVITAFAAFYIRTALGLSVKDPTSGFRVFTRQVLEAIPWSAVRAQGPELLQEILLAAHTRGFRIVEVPIFFEDRRAGQSTFNFRIMIRSFLAVLRLRLFPGELRAK